MDKKNFFRTVRNTVIGISIICLLIAVILLVKYASIGNSKKEKDELVEVNHRVLFLSSYNPLYFTYESQIKGLNKSLYPEGVEYDVCYMDTKGHDSPESIQNFHDYLKKRLETYFDYEAVLLADDDALRFALAYQDELFSGLPMVFFGINDLELAKRAAENPLVTGFYERNYLEPTVSIAIKLFPKRKTLVALHDQSAAGKSDISIFLSFCEKNPDYAFIDLDSTVLSQDELISLLESLPKDSILFYMTCYTDKNNKGYSMLARTNTIVHHTNVPIFRNYVSGDGIGVLGGIYLDFEAQCTMAGEMLSSILAGADVSCFPLVMDTPSHSFFDYQLMKQYNLDFSLIPKDAVLYNQPDTFFQHYKKILPVVSLIVLSLLLLIIAANLSSVTAHISNEELRISRDNLAESEKQMRYQAEYDEVLDILNRRTITEWLRTTMTEKDTYSIVIIDIDGFKALNENYGHSLADSILQYLVALFKEMAKNGKWKIARFGGDEFLLFVPNEELTEKHPAVQEILSGIRAPIPLGDETLAITASLGISNSDGITLPEQHIINAEIAMYEAKAHGRNGVAVYDDEMKKKAREENRIKEKLQTAFENEGFFMVYQPQISTRTKQVCGYEALVRMKEPGIYPGQFIPVAERNGWVWKIGRITTELAIKQIAAWRDAGHEIHPVSVNYSSSQLNDHGYIDFVKELLDKYSVPACFLEIEITEGLFLEKSALADQIFKRFKEMGIRLLMDDFGTGYSSLGYLTYIPIDVIKLDKSLVDTYLVDGKDSFIKNIIHLMHDLNKEMVIEGVEEKWQFERLREFGADIIQGYYFSKPIPADEAITFTVGDDK